MPALLRTVAVPVWALLMVATVVSWSIGADHGADSNQELATTVIMTTAFAKTWFVGMYFMELRHAPLALRLLFNAWCIVGCAAVLGIYLLG